MIAHSAGSKIVVGGCSGGTVRFCAALVIPLYPGIHVRIPRKKPLVALLMVLFAFGGHHCRADDPHFSGESNKRVAGEVAKCLPSAPRAAFARLAFDYWRGSLLPVSSWVDVKTKDGKPASLILMYAGDGTLPGNAMTLAVLMSSNRITDWVTCWSNTRYAFQEVCIRDFDGDGSPELGFVNRNGKWDTRQLRIRSDERAWLAVYSLTEKGFVRYPTTGEREFPLRVKADASGRSVAFELRGVPNTIRGFEFIECVVKLTNQSGETIEIPPNDWFDLEFVDVSRLTTIRGNGPKTAKVKSGESIEQDVAIVIYNPGEKATIRCKLKAK